MSGYCSDTTKACQRVCLASFFWHIEKCQHFTRFQILLRIMFWRARFFIFICNGRAFENFWTPPSPAPKNIQMTYSSHPEGFYDLLSMNNYTTESDGLMLTPPTLSISSLCMAVNGFVFSSFIMWERIGNWDQCLWFQKVLFFFNNSYSMPSSVWSFQQLHTNSGLDCSGETEGNLIYPLQM
jgi:hypothetical protein